jgi:hypothetical protein
MTDGFSDPITAGQGILVQPGIQSPNFSLAGQTGWAILANGNAYFFQVTTSGNVIIGGSGGWYIYNGLPGLGNTPIAYSVAPGTTQDPFGNALRVAGGIVSNDPGVSSAALLDGGIALGLTGATPSVFDAIVAVSLEGAGQAIELDSGSTGSNTATLLILGDSGSGSPGLTVISGADGNTYDTQRRTQLLASNQIIDQIAGNPQTILSWPVAAGTYRIHGFLECQQGATTVAQGLGFTGPAGSGRIQYYYVEQAVTAQQFSINSNTSLAVTATPAYGTGDTFSWVFDGVITFTAAGTLAVVGTSATVTETFTVISGSFADLMPVIA